MSGMKGLLDDDEGEWWTILEYPELRVLNHWIYCELFHHTVETALLNASVSMRTLSLKTRVSFLSYCIPDCNDKITTVPEYVFDQLYGYAHSPWDDAKDAHRTGCFLLIQERLNREVSSPLYREKVVDALQGNYQEGVGPTARQAFGHPNRPRTSPAEPLLINTIVHKPCLCFRLLLPGGLEATHAEVEALRRVCAQPGAGKEWLEGWNYYQDYQTSASLKLDGNVIGVDEYGENISWGMDKPEGRLRGSHLAITSFSRPKLWNCF